MQASQLNNLATTYISNFIAKTPNNNVSFAKFMQLALSSKYGYYSNVNPFAKQADFYTSSQISSVFGYLIGAWYYNLWLQLKQPSNFILLELGAGSGLLLQDILHVNRNNTNFIKALNLVIVEINPVLQKIQQQNLKNYTGLVKSFTTINSITQLNSNLPILLIANEFLDALPFQQFTLTNNAWQQLYITNNPNYNHSNSNNNNNNNNAFSSFYSKPALGYNKIITQLPLNISNNSVYIKQTVANKYFAYICQLIKQNSGLALFIDYGFVQNTYSSAVRGYYKHNLLNLEQILSLVGLADITYSVNFNALQTIADNVGVNRINTVTQKEFLHALGIQQYLSTINNSSVVKSAGKLINNDMGNKFKALAVFNNLKI